MVFANVKSLVVFFEAGSCYAAQAGLELSIFLKKIYLEGSY
jgi:hypothetical protein